MSNNEQLQTVRLMEAAFMMSERRRAAAEGAAELRQTQPAHVARPTGPRNSFGG